MLRERLKEIDMRITELADYLQVSRPTMYKFIEYYDEEKFDMINKKVLKLFNYINDNELVGKKTVLNFILNNLVDVKELGGKEDKTTFEAIKKYIISNPDSKKSKFIQIISSKDTYDKVILYLTDIYDLLKKRKRTDEEEEKLKPYFEMLKNI